MRVTRNGLAGVLAVLALSACQGDGSSSSAAAASPASEPSPTSSGGELVFQTRGSIWVQTPDGSRRNAAPGVQTDNQHPDWSPDGSQIAFEANFNTIWTVGRDGTGEQERFTCEAPCANAFEPAWSPDGTTLAFIHILGDGTHTVSSQLMGLDVESGDTSVLYEDTSGDVWEYTPRWSGDGTRLVVEHDVFASNRLDEEQTLSSELRVIDPTTGTATPLKGTVGAEAPDWSPTADLIVFSDDGNLFTIHADGSHQKRLTRFKARRESAIQPTFTPDGTGVVFTWVTGVQGSGVESTVAAVLRLSDGTVTAVQGADGATHARLQP